MNKLDFYIDQVITIEDVKPGTVAIVANPTTLPVSDNVSTPVKVVDKITIRRNV